MRLAVRVRPRASADRIEGVERDADGRAALAVRLRAPPVDGAANAALIALLAKALHLRKSDISVRSGEIGRRKLIDLRGDPAPILARLEALAAQHARAEGESKRG